MFVSSPSLNSCLVILWSNTFYDKRWKKVFDVTIIHDQWNSVTHVWIKIKRHRCKIFFFEIFFSPSVFTLFQLSWHETKTLQLSFYLETKPSAMAGTELFKQRVPFTYKIDGSINGKKFSIEGKGSGDSAHGTLKGRWTCTSGKCPMSWQALAPILGYGFE